MSMRNRMELRVAIAGILAMAAGTAALAQESKSPETMVLEEIVVTAEKRQANLQDVPVAVSAFTSETRDLLGITNIQDLTDFTPGLSYASTLDRMSLRGVGRLTNNYGSDPGIATYSDGFYTASNVEAGKRPIHTERIEVLRGPQGTLYGRNSIGGALNVISKRPTETFQGEMRATAGNYDTQIFDGSVSGPITDWLRYTRCRQHRRPGRRLLQRRGRQRDRGRSERRPVRRSAARVQHRRAIDGWFKYCTSEWDQARRVDRAITPYDIAPRLLRRPVPDDDVQRPTAASVPERPPSRRFTGTNPSLTRSAHFNTDTPFRTNARQRRHLTLETDLATSAGADLKYVGGYQGYTYQQDSDFDGVAPRSVRTGDERRRAPVRSRSSRGRGVLQEDKEYYSNEINLISTGEGPFQWILGLYQYHEQVNQNQGIRAPLQPELQNPRAARPRRRTASTRPPVRRILTTTCRSPVRCSRRTRTRRSARSTTS